MKNLQLTKEEEHLLIKALNHTGNSIVDQVQKLKSIDREMDTKKVYDEAYRYFDLAKKIESNNRLGSTESSNNITELEARTETYDWGKIMFVYPKDESWKAVFHPEHLESLSKLGVGEDFTFTDEQGKKWMVRNQERNVFELIGKKKGIFRIEL